MCKCVYVCVYVGACALCTVICNDCTVCEHAHTLCVQSFSTKTSQHNESTYLHEAVACKVYREPDHTRHGHRSYTSSLTLPAHHNVGVVLVSVVSNLIHLLSRYACRVVQVPGGWGWERGEVLVQGATLKISNVTCMLPCRREWLCPQPSLYPSYPPDRAYRTLHDVRGGVRGGAGGGGECGKGETGVQRRVRNILVEEMYCNNNNTQKKKCSVAIIIY